MIGISQIAWPPLLLSIAILSHKADSWCRNSETSRPLQFEKLTKDFTYRMFLIEGFQLQITCCVVSTSPLVSWMFNGKPLHESGDLFVLSENGQVLQSSNEGLINITILAGVYNCTAVEDNETLSAAYTVLPVITNSEKCSQGKTTNVILGHPPSSVYRVIPGSSLTLECSVLLTCHTSDGFEEVYWEKYYMRVTDNASEPGDDDDPNKKSAYFMSVLSERLYDNHTGNYLNVTTRNLSRYHTLVTAILYITNITDNDLHDPYNADGYAYLSCDNNDTACRTNRTKNYYHCGYGGSGTTNPLQNALAVDRIVRLFNGDAPTSAPEMTVNSGSNRMEQDGVIIGSTIGAVFILVIVFALLFVAYEWHLKLYISRVLLQIRRNNGTKTDNYEYNCYVACCMKDDRFVHEVLRGHMEDQYGYRLCLPERDFSIGNAIPDEIERCIRSSEYFMAVISPGFWETEWCSLSVDLALRTNAKVVAVISKELRNYQRDHGNKLMTALKTPGCTTIESSFLKQELSWEKLVLRLRYAMPRLDSN